MLALNGVLAFADSKGGAGIEPALLRPEVFGATKDGKSPSHH